MPLRRRLAVATALAVGVAVAAAAVVAYLVVRRELRGQVDDQLHDQSALIRRFQATPRPRPAAGVRDLPAPPPRRGGSATYVQILTKRREVQVLGEGEQLPVDARVRAVAAGKRPAGLADLDVSGQHLRVLIAPLRGGGAVQLGRSLDGIDSVLARLRWILVALCAGGIALAALLGRLAARRLVAPIVRVTDAARHIEHTQDLGRRIEVSSNDEVGELADRFNKMVAALERSVAAQRQLVADASHELRTPVTSLRTNIEVLAEARELVADLIELARGDAQPAATEDVRLDALVAEALCRARRHAPGVRFAEELEPTVVEGVPERLARAVNNLLDNAAAHADAVDVRVGPVGVVVRDHGTGIDPEDVPFLFDRFYRGAGERAHRGTGLGLAIVRQVAEQHGGSVRAVNADGGGALFELRLPGTAVVAAPRLAAVTPARA
jgi:two-component system, OmpR family, sensor histidine kinase MprB